MNDARREASRSTSAVLLGVVALCGVGCLGSTPDPEYTESSSTPSESSTGGGPKKENSLTGRTGSCLLRLEDKVQVGGAPGLLVIALDFENGSVKHAEYATNGVPGPTIGSEDDGGERLTEGEWGNVTVTLIEERWQLVAKPKTLKLKISGDELELDGVPDKGKCTWK